MAGYETSGVPMEGSASALEVPQGVDTAGLQALSAAVAQDFLDTDSRQLRLEFQHDCRFVGCQQTDCRVCRNSRHRRCVSHISPKGYVDMELKPKCKATARVVVVDGLTGLPVHEDVPDIQLEMAVMDGPGYDRRLLELGAGAELSREELEGLLILKTVKPAPVPLLVSAVDSDAEQAHDGKVLVPLKKGAAELPRLTLKGSCEAIMKGRKPPFRLVACAVGFDGRPANIQPAVSDGFVITTRRTKPDAKAEIPHWDDDVKVLENIGGATVKKLENLAAIDLRLPVPDSSVRTVGQLRTLMLAAEEQPWLSASLQKALCIRKDQWETVNGHLAKAIQPTRVLRTWFPGPGAGFGLLFRPEDGKQDPFMPLDLLQRKDGDDSSQAARIDRHGPDCRRRPFRNKDVLRAMMALKRQAEAAWWREGHPGWDVSPWDSADRVPVITCATANSPSPPASGKRQADQISHSLPHQMPSMSHPRKRQASDEIDIDPLALPPPGAVRRGSPPAQLSARHSAERVAAPALAPMRSSSTPPDFFRDGSGVSFTAAAEFVPVKQSPSPERAIGVYGGQSGVHAHGSRAVAAGLPAGKYGLQPAFGPPRPLVSAAPDPPASAAFPLLPLLQLGPQTHAQPPATAAPPGRLDSTREDFWMGQMVMQQEEAGRPGEGLAPVRVPAWTLGNPSSQNVSYWGQSPQGASHHQLDAYQGLLVFDDDSPPSAFGSGPFQPHSAKDTTPPFLDPLAAEAGQPGSATSSPRPMPSPFANPPRGAGAGPAEDTGEQPPSAGKIQTTLSDVVPFPPDWMELANKLRSCGLAGNPKLAIDQEMDLLVGHSQALSEPMLSALLGSRPLGSLSMLSLPLDSAILDVGALPFDMTADHQLVAQKSSGLKPVSSTMNDTLSPEMHAACEL